MEAAPLAGLPAAVALDLRGEALQELQACREVRANGRAVAELAGSIDVRARAVGELLVPVLAAIGEGAPLLETGERLRAAAGTGALSQESAASLGDAFEFIGYVRLQHQVALATAFEGADHDVGARGRGALVALGLEAQGLQQQILAQFDR